MINFQSEFMDKYTPPRFDLTHKNLGPLTVLNELDDTKELMLQCLATLGVCCLDNYEQQANYNHLHRSIIDEIGGKSSEIETVVVLPPYEDLLTGLFVAIITIFEVAKNNGSGITNEDISKMLLKILRNIKEVEYDVETFIGINLILLGAYTLESISFYDKQMQYN
jgi:hypothetical protein